MQILDSVDMEVRKQETLMALQNLSPMQCLISGSELILDSVARNGHGLCTPFAFMRACMHCFVNKDNSSYQRVITYRIAPNFRGQIIVISVRCELITKFLSTKIFAPMGVSIGAAMNHEKCCL